MEGTCPFPQFFLGVSNKISICALPDSKPFLYRWTEEISQAKYHKQNITSIISQGIISQGIISQEIISQGIISQEIISQGIILQYNNIAVYLYKNN